MSKAYPQSRLRAQNRLQVLCMIWSSVFFYGCSNACDDASEKFSECFSSNPSIDPDSETDAGDQCLDETECVANCINEAECADIQAAFDGESNTYSSCTSACQNSAE